MRLVSVIVLLAIVVAIPLAQVDKPIDDRSIPDTIVKAASQQIASGNIVEASTLRSQLNRESTHFSLPAVRATGSGQLGFYSKAKSGVLVVAGIYKCSSCQNWHASCAGGFVLTADGKAATNYHVIEQANMKVLAAMASDGQIYPVESVLAANKQTDSAIVQLKLPEGKRLSPLPVATSAEVGDSVFVLSHPDSHFYTLTKGIVSRYSLKGQTTWLCVSADYAKGSSGCPVLNEKGQVVGMVANTESIYYTNDNGKQENLQMVIRNCVPSASILRLIR